MLVGATPPMGGVLDHPKKVKKRTPDGASKPWVIALK